MREIPDRRRRSCSCRCCVALWPGPSVPYMYTWYVHMHGPRRETVHQPPHHSSCPPCLPVILSRWSSHRNLTLCSIASIVTISVNGHQLTPISKTALAIMGSPYLLSVGDPAPTDEEKTKSLKGQLGCWNISTAPSVLASV